MFGEILYVFRGMRRSPAFVVTSVLLISIGCGLTGAVFATVRGWLSLDRAIPNADRLVVVAPVRDGTVRPTSYFRESSYQRLFETGRFRTVHHLFATQPERVVVSTGDASLTVRMEAIAGAYFEAIGVPPLLGRPLVVGEANDSGRVPVVLGEGAWRRLFQGDPNVVGRPVKLSDRPAIIVGVMPHRVRGFTVPTSTIVDLWAPVQGVRWVDGPRTIPSGQVFGRLADGASVAEAQAEFGVAAIEFDPNEPGLAASILPVEYGVISARARLGLRLFGTALVALSSLVLLITCANLASILLARGASRASELAVRTALGATPGQILRVQLIETGAVAGLGALIGFAMITWASRLFGGFTLFQEGGSVGTGALVVDAWVAGYFLALAIGAGLAVGVLPALRAIRTDSAQVLASSGARGRTTGRFERLRTGLVASQVAATTVLLVVGGLFARSALRASDYEVLFDARRVALGSFNFGASDWTEQQGRVQQERLLAIARSIPGVEAASVSTGLPAGGGGELVDIETDEAARGDVACRALSISPDYFDVIGRSPRRGRRFTRNDGTVRPGVAIVSEAAASRLWPGRNAVGQRLRIRRGEPLEIVGILGEMDRTAVDAADRCYVFVPIAQRYDAQFILAIRGASDAQSLVGPFVATMAAGAPDLSMFNVTTAEDHLNRSSGPRRLVATALVVLAVCGVVVAIVGVHGVMTHLVGLRHAEFSLRRILGATNWTIYRLVCGEAARMIGIGLAVGLPIAYIVAALSASALVGTTPHEPTVYLAVSILLPAVGTLAAWWPARRAARAEPADALRSL